MPDAQRPQSPHLSGRPRTGGHAVSSVKRAGGRIALGSIAGIEIGLDYSWFVIFGLVLLFMGVGYLPKALPETSTPAIWMLAILATTLFFASVLAHELAHSVVARLSGLRIGGIDLFIFGGISKLHEEPESPGTEFIVAIVGPLASFVLAGIFVVLWLVLQALSSPLATVAGYLGWLNFMLGAFNLVPGLPLDGGRVLRSAIWYHTGNLRYATRVATSAGQFLGYALIIFGIGNFFLRGDGSGIWLAFIGWFILQAAQASYQHVLVRESIAGVKIHEIMSTTPPIMPGRISIQDAIDHYFMEYPASVFPVMQGNDFLGVVSVEQMRSVEQEARFHTPVAEVVRTIDDDHIVSRDDEVSSALEKMNRHSDGLLVVIEDDRFAGIIVQQDLLRLVQLRLQLGQQPRRQA